MKDQSPEVRLAVKKALLLQTIAQQRQLAHSNFAPLARALTMSDRAFDKIHWLQTHASWVALAGLGLVILRPRAAMRCFIQGVDILRLSLRVSKTLRTYLIPLLKNTTRS